VPAASLALPRTLSGPRTARDQISATPRPARRHDARRPAPRAAAQRRAAPRRPRARRPAVGAAPRAPAAPPPRAPRRGPAVLRNPQRPDAAPLRSDARPLRQRHARARPPRPRPARPRAPRIGPPGRRASHHARRLWRRRRPRGPDRRRRRGRRRLRRGRRQLQRWAPRAAPPQASSRDASVPFACHPARASSPRPRLNGCSAPLSRRSPLLPAPPPDKFPGGGPGRGGAWWNDPTYWAGLAIGAVLAMPLVNLALRGREGRQDKARAGRGERGEGGLPRRRGRARRGHRGGTGDATQELLAPSPAPPLPGGGRGAPTRPGVEGAGGCAPPGARAPTRDQPICRPGLHHNPTASPFRLPLCFQVFPIPHPRPPGRGLHRRHRRRHKGRLPWRQGGGAGGAAWAAQAARAGGRSGPGCPLSAHPCWLAARSSPSNACCLARTPRRPCIPLPPHPGHRQGRQGRGRRRRGARQGGGPRRAQRDQARHGGRAAARVAGAARQAGWAALLLLSCCVSSHLTPPHQPSPHPTAAPRRPTPQVDPVAGAAHAVSDRAAQAKDTILQKGARGAGRPWW
jgi:hypothetical protein